MPLIRLAALLLLACAALPALAQRGEVRVFVFGNSLVNHVPDGAANAHLTTVPYWLGQLSAAAGKRLALDGEWGFLRDFADLPPEPKWGFPGVDGAWDEGAPFEAARFDTVIVTPANFIQDRPAEAPYQGDAASPLSASLSLLDWTAERTDGARLLIYEGWPDMGALGDEVPERPEGLADYHALTRGAYHDWFDGYRRALSAARPDADVALIPVADRLARWLTGPLADVPPRALYADTAPHGTPDLYFLAAMVTYAALYETPPPADYVPPPSLHPAIREAYPTLAADLAQDRAEAPEARPADPEPAATAQAPAPDTTPDAASDAATAPDPADAEGDTASVDTATAPDASDASDPVDAEDDDAETRPTKNRARQPSDDPAVTPAAGADPEANTSPTDAATAPAPTTPTPPGQPRRAGGHYDPGLAMGLNGIADWSTQQPFLDLMKTARPWVGHLRGEQWGGFPAEQLEADGWLDGNGWPKRLPPDVTKLETFVLTDMPPEAASLAGTYLLRWQGSGDLRVTGRADNTRYSYSRREVRFDYTPGDGPVAISFTRTDADDPIRDITLIREEHEALFEAGAIFNPAWLARVQDLRLVRFMDWSFTNGSEIAAWDQRPREDDYTYVRRGVPLEVMLRLANRIGADPWFNIPHLADDAYVRAFAQAVKDGLYPRLRAHVEYSNEIWNFVFPQAQHAAAQARERWDTEEDGAWIQWAGLRAAEVAGILSETFGAEAADRLVNVVAVHTGWPGLEEVQLEAPLAPDTTPAEAFDAYAVAGYFGFELGTPEMRDSVSSWVEASRLVAEVGADAEELTGPAREAWIATHADSTASRLAAATVADGSLAELTDRLLPHHARAAARYGLELVMYEGGTHVTGLEEVVEDAALTAFFTDFNYSQEMAALYEVLLQAWAGLTDAPFNAFVDVSAPGKWGSWGALRHLDDANPRWDALMEANVAGGAPGRAPGTFLQGVTLEGGDGPDRLDGTVEEDVLLGGAGDDVLAGHGGADRLHGGDGVDVARLPGARADYRFARDPAGHVTASRDGATVLLVAVEEVAFDGDGPEAWALETLLAE